MLQEGLYSLLSGSSSITSLVGTRIFAVDAPPDLVDAAGSANYPCITYSCVGGSGDPTMITTGVDRQRIELNALSFNSYKEAATIRAAIRKLLDGWSQLLGDGTNVLGAILLNPGTDFVTEQRCFRCLVEFYVDITLPS